MKKHVFVPFALILLLLLSACGQTTSSQNAPLPEEKSSAAVETSSSDLGESQLEDSHYPVTITNYNYAGEEITLTFDKAPERVLAVYQGCVETMIVLGLEDHVIASYGLDNEVKEEWKDGFSRMKYNESSFAPDKETVVMLNPDLIFSWGSIFDEKMLGDVGYWIGNGTNTYINTNTRVGGPRILENEYADILNIGKIFNVEDKAEAIVNQMKADVEKAKAASEAMPEAPSVGIIGFYDAGIRNFGLELAGDIAEHLKVDVMKSPERYVGKEDLIAADPDVMFIEYMPRPEGGGDEVKNEELAKFLDDPALASMSAIKNGRVYPIMLGDIYAPAVRTGDGIRTIAGGVFPGIFD